MFDFIFIVGIVIFVLLAFLLAEGKDGLQTDAIERGYALYCPDTGEFAWKGECDE